MKKRRSATAARISQIIFANRTAELLLVLADSRNRMYAQKFNVQVVIRGAAKPCPLEWLDQFCMRNFTNAAEFDDTLPVADGKIESSFRLTPERFAAGLAAWLTQRGRGEGQPVEVQVTAGPQSQPKR